MRALLVLLPGSSAPALAASVSKPAQPAPALNKRPAPALARRMAMIQNRRPAALPPSVSLEPRTPLRPDDPREGRISHLREQVLGILRGPPLGRMRVGIEVLEADSGEVLLAHNAASAFNPASNTKILTTAAAMKLLGADWRYRTVLLGPAQAAPGAQGTPAPEGGQKTASLKGGPLPSPPGVGTLRGDLFLQGSGDPSLTASGLAELARDLTRAGISRVEGDLVVDGQFRSLREIGKNGALSAAGEGALIVNRNAYTVHVSPAAAGHPAGAWIEPRSPYFVLDSRVQTVKGKRGKVLVDHFRRDGRLMVTVRGRLGEQHPEATVSRRMPDGGAFAAATLGQALGDFGITLTGQVRIGPPPGAPLQVLAEHQSPPLSEVCRLSNKDSNNFVADTIFKTLGGERFGLPGTLAKGQKAVAEWLSLLGINPGRMKIINGSGLTHENRLRPDDLGHLLRSLYQDLQLAPEFLQSLAIGGIDGTIRHRFHGATVGLVRAKTGTLSGVSALSGYVGEKHKVLIFSILVEGFRPKRLDEVRHAQVVIVESLMRFLRADGGRPEAPGPLLAPPGQGRPEDRDDESDGDPT